jgi:hypothetical protein
MCGYCEEDRKKMIDIIYPKKKKKINPSKIFNGIKKNKKKVYKKP